MTTVNGLGGVVASDIEHAPSSVAASGGGTILPDPLAAMALSGDPGAELAALAVQSGERQQTVAQTARDTEAQIEVGEDHQQVDAMHQKARDIRAAGIWEGGGMIGEGACSFTGAFLPSPKLGNSFVAGGKGADGVAKVVAAGSRAAEANDDATAAAAKSASDQAKSAADDLHDVKKGAGDFISAALDFYREYTSAQASANSAALHRA